MQKEREQEVIQQGEVYHEMNITRSLNSFSFFRAKRCENQFSGLKGALSLHLVITQCFRFITLYYIPLPRPPFFLHS